MVWKSVRWVTPCVRLGQPKGDFYCMMSEEIIAVVWPWRARKDAVTPRGPRRGPWIQFVVMTSVGLLFRFVWGHVVMAYVLWGLATLLLAGLLFSEKILRGFERTGHWLAHGIGTAVTWILLVPFFYVVFSAGHLILRLRGKDPMQRSLDPGQSTYWTPHQKLDIETRYHRQF